MSRTASRKTKPIPILLAALFLAASIVSSCGDVRKSRFRFVFMTDIHVQPELRATEGFLAAIDRVNRIGPDFVITGGDLIADALEAGYPRADSLYRLYIETSGRFRMPVYNALGNHEIFGLYPGSGVDPAHPEYGKAMFENRIGGGNRYRSFDHRGWHFILLDGVGTTQDREYTGRIDEEQMEWLRHDLERVGTERPVVISVHIPLLSAAKQFLEGPEAADKPGITVSNAYPVLELCRPYNVKLILQGHLHVVEEIVIADVRFITGGAVSGNKWEGPKTGFEEGFVVVEVKGDECTWHYEDHGWEANGNPLPEDD